MLRGIVLFFLLANGVYFAWSQGLLAAYGLAPAPVSEPQRLAQQIHPELVVLVPPHTAEAASAAAAPAVVASAPAEPTECLTAGLFDVARGTLLAKALADTLPAGSWSLEPGVEPGRWMVYMGRYANAELLERKKAELRGMRIRFEPAPANLEPGLSLGSFDSEAGANKLLGEVTQHGVRTAHVVAERLETHGMRLKLPAVNAALKTRLEALKPELGGKALKTCPA
ncbi:SPOR domain-containing protein [Rhodoferax sp. WC2427]|uniref:SPOR domain-containing protein n=1 Tax=Rhodoferax sp. WC2427 TaxID=3234144 RepID=UPI0034675457